MSDLVKAAAEPAETTSMPRFARLAVTVVFFVNGLLFASWTAHIPHVKALLRLTDGTLGIALAGAPVGSVIALLIASRLLPRLGSRRMVRITLVGYSAAGPLVGLTRSTATLFLALLAWGGFQAMLDVSMNTQAIAVERRARRPLMPGFHGAWSIGAFAGAAAGVVGVAIGLSLSVQLLLLAIPAVLVAGWFTTSMIGDAWASGQQAAGPAETETTRAIWIPIVILGAISLADMLCEGAVADWAAVYLRTSLNQAAAVAALGYTCYALAMVTVRLGGNRLLTRFAVHRLLPFLASVATVTLIIGLAVNTVPALLIGFAGLGAGIAAVIPATFSSAGRVPGIHAGTAVSLVSAFGWAGFVCGPPLIGQIANATSLRLALVLLPILTGVIVVTTATSRTLRS